MENTVDARVECTYTLLHVLSLGHNCMLMITVIKNSAFYYLVWRVPRRFGPIIACAVQSIYRKAAAPKTC